MTAAVVDARPVRVRGLGRLALRMTRARFVARQGETLLYFASVGAYTICGALALAVASGTWLFYRRWQQPTGIHAEMVAVDSEFTTLLSTYFTLAVIASGLLVPSLVSLSAGAAVLGARARERRLAVLRLLGLSSGDVTRMSLADVTIQAAMGALLGAMVYFVTIPAWQALELIGMPLAPAEMTPPLWLAAVVLVVMPLIGLASAWWGLRQVRISPLGVSRQSSRPRLRWWRVVAFVVLFVIAWLGTKYFALASATHGYIILVTLLVVIISGINLVGPYVLQTLARPAVLAGSPSVLWAARRVIANPRAAWRRVVGVGLLAFIAGYTSLTPLVIGTRNDATHAFSLEATQWDMAKGSLLTLSIGLMLTATSLLISQASAVYERAEQSVALCRLGTAPRLLTRTAWLETLIPLGVALILGAGGGMVMALPLIPYVKEMGIEPSSNGFIIVGSVVVAGLLLAVLALALCQPLQRQVLAEQRRAAD